MGGREGGSIEGEEKMRERAIRGAEEKSEIGAWARYDLFWLDGVCLLVFFFFHLSLSHRHLLSK